MSEASTDWIETARAAARGKTTPGYEVVRGQLPPVLEGDGVRGVFVPFLAIIAWLGAYFRELVSDGPLDPLGLVLRLLAIGLSIRGALLAWGLVLRVKVASRATKSALVLSTHGLYVTDGTTERTLERSSVLGVVEPGSWQTRSAGRRWSPVYVVGSSSDALYLELAPVFEHSPGVLAEKLMRWSGARYNESPVFPPPASLASRVYDDAARGVVEPGTLVVAHGSGWLRRGPYASVLLALALLEGFLRLRGEQQAEVWPVAVAAVLLALVVPVGWIASTRREIAVRRGIAFVLTPAELLLRTRAGVHRARWGGLQRVTLESRRTFSVLDGLHLAKTLVLKRKDEPAIRYEEAFLGVPAEVAQVLLDSYRTGVLLPENDAPAT